MKIRILSLSAGLSLALFVFGPLGRSEDAPADLNQGVFDQLSAVTGDATAVTAELKKQPGVETQLKGAVHDAFAEAVTDPKPGPVVKKEPPKDLEEMPPTNKPEGEDIQWYGGYWEFDQDRDDFTWITGIYRKPPPRRQWMAGNWVKVEAGWQRQHGMWLTLEIASISFVPTAPPAAPVEEVANTPPDDKSVFVPGNYEYKETEYVWKPGKWVPLQSNWVWIPAHWVWTPCGYAFVPGYWDYLIEVRGLLYAPVCVDPAYITPGFVYTPCCVVHNTCLLEALFVRPGCGYFFGAYFKNSAYTSWPDACIHGKICDPLFTHYKLHNRGEGNWEGSLRALYTGRQRGTIASPPSNLKEFGKFVQDYNNKNIGAKDVRHNLLIGSANKINTNVVRMRTLDNAGVQGQKKFSDQLRNAGKDLAIKQSQHLQANRGSSNGGKVLKFDMDKSINSQFRSFNNGQNNGKNSDNKNVGNKNVGTGNGLGNVNVLGNRNGNNGQNGNGQKDNGGKNLGNGQGNVNVLGNRNGGNSNGANGNSNKNGNSNGSGNVLINRNTNDGSSGNGNKNSGNGNNNGQNGNTGISPKSNQGTGTPGGNNTRRFEGNTNGNNGFTPKLNTEKANNGTPGGNGGSGNGNTTTRRFEGSSNGNNGFTPKFNTEKANNGTPGGNGGSGNTTIRRFESGNSGSSGNNSFRSSEGSNSSRFSPGSGNSGSSGFSSKSFQDSGSGSFGGSSGSSGGSRSFGGGGGNSGGRGGRR